MMGTTEKLEKAKSIGATLGLPPGTLYRMAREQKIKTYRIGVKGRGVRFRLSEVLAALAVPAAGTTPKVSQ